MLTVSTASPYKFASDVLSALGKTDLLNNYSGVLAPLYALKEATGVKIPAPLASLAERKVRFTECVKKEDMERTL